MSSTPRAAFGSFSDGSAVEPSRSVVGDEAAALPRRTVLGFLGLLRELGVDREVRERVRAFDPEAARWLGSPDDEPFCPLRYVCAVMNAALDVLGEERLRSLGTRRFAQAMETGQLAPMLRSWSRAFADDVRSIVRLTPHLWRGSTRGLGDIRVVNEGPSSARIEFTTTHPLFLACRGWHVFLEGWSLGLLAMRFADCGEGDERLRDDRAVMVRSEGRLALEVSWS